MDDLSPDSTYRPPKNIAAPLSAKFFFRDFPEHDPAVFLTELGMHFQQPELVTDEEYMKLVQVHDYRQILQKDQPTPGITLLMPEMQGISLTETALEQCRNWPEASSVLKNCEYEVGVMDFESLQMDHMNRLHLFNCAMISLIRATNPDVVYFPGAEKICNPPDLLQELGGEGPHLLAAAVHIRKHDLADGAIILDTVGMHTLGLTDFQIRANPQKDLNAVANLLWNFCYLVYQHGDHLITGHALQGLAGTGRWHCTRENAWQGPERVNISLLPEANWDV